jgi:peptide chain release factor 2
MYSEIISQLTRIEKRLASLRETLNVELASQTLLGLEGKMAQPGFWDHNDKAQEVIAEVKRLKGEVEPVIELGKSVEDALELAKLYEDEGETAHVPELQSETASLEDRLDALELSAVLSEPTDRSNAFLSVHAGAGGTESCDWASMLVRMYSRFCERQGFTATMVDVVDGEEAGVRNATLLVKGNYAYGYLKSEIGVHRLVRISPFDAKSRRHTSFAAVDVIPEMPEAAKDIDVASGDIRVDTFRAGGAGGQHVNKTDSAVRITHLPTGLVVQCQNERSQHSNRATALKMLKARLLREEERKRNEELSKLYGEKGEIAFGSQIRSYTLQPFTLVKDHRTHVEVGNANGVLDGELMDFVEAYLRSKRKAATAQK